MLGRRKDGYHEIVTVLQTVSLWDELSFAEAPTLRLECDEEALQGEENLVYKAARLLGEESGTNRGALITLRKGIPVAAGLGGGSSDGAATLNALNDLWEIGLDRSRLLSLASRLGSDVPFFVDGGTAMARGRGDQVVPLRPLPEMWLVLLHPPLHLAKKTATLYNALMQGDYTGGEATAALAAKIGQGLAPAVDDLVNVFERVAYRLFPGLETYRQRFLEAGAHKVHLAGSGPTLFCLAEDEAAGRRLAERLGEEGLNAHLVYTLTPN
ncbi:MAG: 4-(cytidine 5'-diphospho)-2-C-methyl-D-erythritol kinase [Chloroflexi bacterium]|nr:4-(cytidine 5'-diphospho)-2-C-methyl-D-erythritol kinase [Chloroflexota bacterium]